MTFFSSMIILIFSYIAFLWWKSFLAPSRKVGESEL